MLIETNETTAAHNAAIEREQLQQWAGIPGSAVGYYVFPGDPAGGMYRRAFHPVTTGAYVSTWLGTRIGTITAARVHTNNFGARVVSISMTGTNGAKYHGRASWDNGTVIRLRLRKG